MEKESALGFFQKETSMMFAITHELELFRNKALETYGITGKQAIILYFLLLNTEKQLTQREFEYKFNLCSSTINSVLNYLEDGGFLTRIVSETDGRAKNIKATDKGMKMSAVIKEQLQKEMDIVTKGFSEKEQEQFRDYLFRALNNIKGNKNQ